MGTLPRENRTLFHTFDQFGLWGSLGASGDQSVSLGRLWGAFWGDFGRLLGDSGRLWGGFGEEEEKKRRKKHGSSSPELRYFM